MPKMSKVPKLPKINEFRQLNNRILNTIITEQDFIQMLSVPFIQSFLVLTCTENQNIYSHPKIVD